MSSHIDAIAGMAGMTDQKQPFPPATLVSRFCQSVETDNLQHGAVLQGRGFCGWTGQGSLGYDDGYYFMGDLEERGWRAIASRGDWPYVVYCWWAKDGEYAVCEYCEADFSIWVFNDIEKARAFVKTLRECP
jgi:hypothetical protein